MVTVEIRFSPFPKICFYDCFCFWLLKEVLVHLRVIQAIFNKDYILSWVIIKVSIPLARIHVWHIFLNSRC